ncbi:unnamed protein product [Urochloa humidicola]
MVSLPEDILGYIHTFMPMQDAARAACVSRAFLRSWQSYPKLNFNMFTLGMFERDRPLFDPIEDEPAIIEEQMRTGVITTYEEYYKKNSPLIREFSAIVNHIMHNHTGTGIKTFRLEPPHYHYIDPAVLDRWFQAVMVPGITEFELHLNMGDDGLGYNFPCSLLSSNKGCSTLTSFTISGCSLHSLDKVGCLTSLRRVLLLRMRVTGKELSCFLSSSPALEELRLSYCSDMVCLEIPCLLSRLRLLYVQNCNSLKMIGCDAPKLKTFAYVGLPTVHICLGDSSPLVREMMMSSTDDSGMLRYATTKLPSIAPNVRKLFLSSCFEIATDDTLIKKLNKFRRLKYLQIQLDTPSHCPDYDFYSLVSFLNACPVLVSFVLRLEMRDADDAIPEYPHGVYSQGKRRHLTGKSHHSKLKNVLISGFRPAKGLLKLTRHILANAASLKRLILDTAYGCKVGPCPCLPLTPKALMEARNAVDVIRRYVEGEVPSSVGFEVIEPCIKCHTG